MKGKPILPTLKEKNRYIVYKITSKKRLAFEDIKWQIYSEIKGFVGDLGIAKANVNIMPETFIEKNQTGIIKTNSENKDLIKSAIMMIKEINREKTKVETIYTSGTIKKAKEFQNKTKAD